MLILVSAWKTLNWPGFKKRLYLFNSTYLNSEPFHVNSKGPNLLINLCTSDTVNRLFALQEGYQTVPQAAEHDTALQACDDASKVFLLLPLLRLKPMNWLAGMLILMTFNIVCKLIATKHHQTKQSNTFLCLHHHISEAVAVNRVRSKHFSSEGMWQSQLLRPSHSSRDNACFN